jgi:hypothetical protein
MFAAEILEIIVTLLIYRQRLLRSKLHQNQLHLGLWQPLYVWNLQRSEQWPLVWLYLKVGWASGLR